LTAPAASCGIVSAKSDEPDHVKPVVALYLRYYLSPSETFVYRQLAVSRMRSRRSSWRRRHPISIFSRRAACSQRGKASSGGWDAAPPDGERKVLGGYSRTGALLEKCDHREARAAHPRPFRTLRLTSCGRPSLGVPLIVTFHGFDASRLLADGRYTRQLRTLFDYAHAVTVSKNMAERLTPSDSARPVHGPLYRRSRRGVRVRRTPAVAVRIESGEPLTFLQVRTS